MSIDSFFFYSEKLESRMGFNDLDLIKLCKTNPFIIDMIQKLSQCGFKYLGDTNSDSKACTDTTKKRIFIGKQKTTQEACLSLVYELTNALNSSRINKVRNRYFSDRRPTMDKAMKYAKAIISIEAEAVYNRSLVALKMGLTDLIHNKNYVKIVESVDHPSSALLQIRRGMINDGRVHQGKIKALDFYISQYFECNTMVD